MKPSKAPENRLLSIDELDRGIVNLATHISAATYELLLLVRQFDERAGWLQWGFVNCAEWLHWRCDLSMSAAREKVRVAHALKALPMIATAFSTGELSYSKVRPLTRVATVDNETSLLAFARDTTATQTPEYVDECWSAHQADALVTIANAYLSGNGEPSACASDNDQVTVHVDRSALAVRLAPCPRQSNGLCAQETKLACFRAATTHGLSMPITLSTGRPAAKQASIT